MNRPVFFGAWLRTLPMRRRGLVLPFARVLGVFVASYASATALLKPWLWGHWWSLGVPAVAGLGACWWLWQPWARLATNSRAESRRGPLLFTWALLVALGWGLRTYLRYRLGEVRDSSSVQALGQPGNAVCFRLHGSFYADWAQVGRYPSLHATTRKGGTKNYFASYDYACPLLAAASDTGAFHLSLPAWLSYTYRADLGDDLTPGERSWRYQNLVARADARLDSLRATGFTYLLRRDAPRPAQYRAVRWSQLAPYNGSPLLVTPIRAPFAARGRRTRRPVLGLVGLGSGAVLLLLLLMPLRPSGLPEPFPCA